VPLVRRQFLVARCSIGVSRYIYICRVEAYRLAMAGGKYLLFGKLPEG